MSLFRLCPSHTELAIELCTFRASVTRLVQPSHFMPSIFISSSIKSAAALFRGHDMLKFLSNAQSMTLAFSFGRVDHSAPACDALSIVLAFRSETVLTEPRGSKSIAEVLLALCRHH